MRLAHVAMNTIWSSAKHEVATGADLPCVSCVGGKLVQHTFPDQGSDTDDVLAVVHIDLCGPVAKKPDALQEFVQWLAVTERQTKKSVLMLCFDRGGEFLGKQFTDFVNGKGIVHDLTCPYTPQQNGMAEREMRTVLESPETTPYQLLTVKKPDLSLARVRGCMAQFLVLEQQRGGKLKPKARWGLHLGVSEESKGWELLDIADNRHGPASEQTPTVPPTDNSTTTLPLLAKVSEPAAEDVEDVPSPFPSPAPRAPPHVADLRGLTPVSASGDEGRSGALPMAPAKSIDSGQRDVPQVDVRVKSTLPGEEQAKELPPMVVKSAKGAAARQQPTGEQAAAEPTTEQSATGQSAGEPTVVQLDAEGSGDSDDEGEAEDSTDSDMVEVQGGPRRTGRLSRPPDFVVPAAFTTVYDVDADDLVYDDAEDDDEDFPELVPDMHADPEHRWEISTMMVKEALASWKGKAVGRHGGGDPQPRQHGDVGAGRTPAASEHHEEPVYGTDYDETYAPVSSYVMLRIFLSIVAILDLNLMQLDMKNAFLRSKLEWGSRRCAAGRWLEEEPGRHGALLQSRRQQGDLLGTSLRQRPASHQQRHRDAEGAKGAAGGHLRATRDLVDAEVPRAGDRPRRVGA
ncbi:unnamed protein product [Closterium sp. NIES-54]